MPNVAALVDQARSMLLGGFADEASLVGTPYVAGSGLLNLRYPKKQVIVGSLLSVGLNTFYVLEASSDGSNLVVLEGYDGGPSEDAPSNTVVRVRPVYTTWAIFREIAQEIAELSSPQHSLFKPLAITYTRNWTDDTYPWPETETTPPIRLVRGRYQIPGTQAWGNIQSAEWMREQNMTRVRSSVSDANVIELTYAMPFTVPSSLTDTLETIGLSGNLVNVPSLGAASSLALSGEGRRQQPFAQGDPRRPQEVSPGANIGVSRAWEKQKQDMIAAEHARLVREFPWAMAMPEPKPHWRIGGGYAGGGYW